MSIGFKNIYKMKAKQPEPECYEREKGITDLDLALDAGLSTSNVYYILSG